MTKISEGFDREEHEGWLNEQPVDVALVIAARSAQRIAPMLAGLFENKLEAPDSILLPLFRAMELPRAAAKYPARGQEMWPATSAVATGAATATGAFASADAARAAADAATAAAASADAIAAFATAANRAVADAAATAATAAAAASAATVSALQTDRRQIETGLSSFGLAEAPLWRDDQIPDEVYKEWENLKSRLLSLGHDWEIWTGWYEDRLSGHPAQSEALEVARVTLPEAMWGEGPALVNATLRELTDLAGKGGDEAVDQRMAELRRAYPGRPTKAVDNSEKDAESEAEQKRERDEPNLEETDSSDASAAPETEALADGAGIDLEKLPCVWLLQYKPGDRVARWVNDAVPGSELPWKRGNAHQAVIRAGDPVFYWRSNSRSGVSDGGLVGIGRVTSEQTVLDRDVERIPTTVTRFDERAIINRKVVREEMGLSRKFWPGSVLEVPPEEALSIHQALPDHDFPGLFSQEELIAAGFVPPAPPTTESHETPISADRPETAQDFLNRAPLAFALATHVNHTWTAQTEEAEEDPPAEFWPEIWQKTCRIARQCLDWLHMERVTRKTKEPDDAAFILHVDAPWGGGKTTFANFLARILNLKAHGLDPDAAEKDDLIRDLRFDYWEKAFHDRRWFTVHFNAWQHEHVTPPWWNFYESIRRQTMRAILYEDGRCEGGPWIWRTFKRCMVWLRFLVFEWVWRILTWKLVWTCVIIVVSGLGLYYFSTTDAYEQLMASIGGQNDTTGAVFRAVLGVGAASGATLAIFRAFKSGLQTIINSAGASANAASLGVADPIQKFRRHFSWYMRQLDHPVLVIIDDLDRCSPKYVVELVRGLMTIFKSPRVVFVLLGDKDWIETAFAKVHDEMADAHLDAHVSFGGRFAEKAIQLSFLLPEPSEDARQSYLKELLGAAVVDADASDTGEADLEDLEPVLKSVSALFSGAESFSDQSQAAQRSEELLEKSVESAPAERRERLRKAGSVFLNREKMQRAATARSTQQEIKLHGLRPMKEMLPSNPRRVKRIINMVSAYQASAQTAEGVDLGTARWKQLVLWVLIMCEYPKVWQDLVRDAAFGKELLERLDAVPESGKAEQIENASDPENPDEPDETSARIDEILADEALAKLLRGVPFASAKEARSPAHLTNDALVWLRRLTPLE